MPSDLWVVCRIDEILIPAAPVYERDEELRLVVVAEAEVLLDGLGDYRTPMPVSDCGFGLTVIITDCVTGTLPVNIFVATPEMSLKTPSAF